MITNTGEIIDNTNLSSLIESFGIEMKRKGKISVGLCPFHDEKTPSFNIFNGRDGERYKCHGCGVSGNAVSFLMEHEGLDYIEAIEHLASFSNIIIQREGNPEVQKAIKLKKQESKAYYSVWNEAIKFYEWDYAFTNDDKVILQGHRDYKVSTLRKFGVGVAPDGGFLTMQIKNNKDLLKEFIKIGLIKQSGNSYRDFFSDRLLFQIKDHRGNLIALSGRIWEDKKQGYPKYINSPDSPIFQKSNILYGFDVNRSEIRKQDFAYIVEGFTDVLSLYDFGVKNAVASMGTAIGIEHLNLLKKVTTNITLVLDGDTAGFKAAQKAAELAISEGFVVHIMPLPHKEDPDSFIRKNKLRGFDFYAENKQDAIIAILDNIIGDSKDPHLNSIAKEKFIKLLYGVQDKYYKGSIIEIVYKKLKYLKTDIKRDLKDYANKLPEKAPNHIHKQLNEEQQEDIRFYGFYEEDCGAGKRYVFTDGTGHGVSKSNFIIKALFLIIDKKRIVEIQNIFGKKVLRELTMDDLISLNRFKKVVEGPGNFLFEGTETDLNKIKKKIFDKETQCEEAYELGLDKETEQWIFANGMSDGQFKIIDEFGVVKNGENSKFLPYYSKLYLKDKKMYNYERKIVHKNNDVTIKKWAKQFHKVYGKNGMVGISFLFGTIYRDLYFHRWNSFPLLYCFGEKGSGKSTMAQSMQWVFCGGGERMNELSFGTGSTVKGIAGTFAKVNNGLVFIDEYKNTSHPDKINFAKDLWNGIGYTIKAYTGDNQTIYIPVNSTAVLAGQDLPTVEEALMDRCFIIKFKKRKHNEKAFNKLRDMENAGLTNIINELMMLRESVKENLYNEYDELYDIHSHLTSNVGITARRLRNTLQLLAIIKVLEKRIDLPFTYEEFEAYMLERVDDMAIENGSSIEVQKFWEILAANVKNFTVKEDNEIVLTKRESKTILALRMVPIIQEYLVTHRRIYNQVGLEKSTLKNYLVNDPAFIEFKKSFRFNGMVTSAMIFDYKELQNNTGVNIQLSNENEHALADDNEDKDEIIKKLREQIDMMSQQKINFKKEE